MENKIEHHTVCAKAVPEAGSQTYSQDLDYEDLKLKIVQQEGYDAHDFNIFDDRTAEIWRKPYLDGSARELTSGDDRSTEQLRQAVEKMILSGRNTRPRVRAVVHPARTSAADVRVTADIDHEEDLLRDARGNTDNYEITTRCCAVWADCVRADSLPQTASRRAAPSADDAALPRILILVLREALLGPVSEGSSLLKA